MTCWYNKLTECEQTIVLTIKKMLLAIGVPVFESVQGHFPIHYPYTILSIYFSDTYGPTRLNAKNITERQPVPILL